MSLFEKIQKDRFQAMKDKQDTKKSILATLKGELDKGLKMVNGVKANPSDAEVIAVIKKFVNNNRETIKLTKSAGEELPSAVIHAVDVLEEEIAILEAYLPAQLTEEGIKTGIKAAMNLGANNIGAIMKFFKENYEGRYDGNTVKVLTQEALKGE